VFKETALRIFGLKQNGITGSWKQLRDEEYHNLHTSTNMITIVKLRRMSWEGYVRRMVNKRNA
jgi:hypothetical protein